MPVIDIDDHDHGARLPASCSNLQADLNTLLMALSRFIFFCSPQASLRALVLASLLAVASCVETATPATSVLAPSSRSSTPELHST